MAGTAVLILILLFLTQIGKSGGYAALFAVLALQCAAQAVLGFREHCTTYAWLNTALAVAAITIGIYILTTGGVG